MIIAVIGKIGSGKTTLSHFLNYKLGGNYLNLDQTVKQFYTDAKIVAAIRQIDAQLIEDERVSTTKLRAVLFQKRNDESFDYASYLTAKSSFT